MNDRDRPSCLALGTVFCAVLLGIAGTSSAQDCVLFDDFEDDEAEPTWVEANINASRLKIAEANQRVECWGPAANTGGNYISMFNGDGWYVDMNSNWAVSMSFHINAVHPSNGEISIGFYMMIEGTPSTPFIRDGIAVTLGTANYGGVFGFEAIRAWDDGTGYVLTTDSRPYTDKTLYFWYDADGGSFAYGYSLYSPVHTVYGVEALSNLTRTTIGIGGLTIGSVPSSTGDRLWVDDLCLIEGTILGPALGGCCVDEVCSETLEANCAGAWLGESEDCLSGDPCAPEPLYVPGDHATIQEAIDASVEGGEIVVAPGVHGGGSDTEVINTNGKALFIHSSDGSEVTFVNGAGSKRVLVCGSGETTKTVIKGFSFIGGNDPGQGGAIRILKGSSPIIEDCIIRYSTADRGGGVSIENSNPAFIACSFSENDSLQEGGAIDASGTSNFELIDCVVEFNTAGSDEGHAAVNIRDSALAILTGTLVCNNLPTDLVGDWVDAGGNEVCNPCVGDLTGDGVVDGGDLTVVLGFWGTCANPRECLADMTGDGFVDGADLTMILGFWGSCH